MKLEHVGEVRLGFVKGRKTLDEYGFCLSCLRGNNSVPHDYTCERSQGYCPFGRITVQRDNTPGEVFELDDFVRSFGLMPIAGKGSFTAPGKPINLS